MSEFRGLRANVRTDAPSEPETGIGGLIRWSLGCVIAAALAYAAVSFLITPSATPLQPSVAIAPPQPSSAIMPLPPSAAIPTFSGDGNRPKSSTGISPSQAAAIRVAPNELVGKSADEIGKLADVACFKRAHAQYPHWSKTPRLTTKTLGEFHLDDMDHFNVLMQCLLTEAPQRYCTASQRRMIATEVNHYFLALTYMNRDLERLRQLAPNFELTFNGEPIPTAVPNLSVIAAVEARLRDGYLTKDEIAKLGQSAPPDLGARFSQIRPPKSPCPAQPWWAFWRV